MVSTNFFIVVILRHQFVLLTSVVVLILFHSLVIEPITLFFTRAAIPMRTKSSQCKCSRVITPKSKRYFQLMIERVLLPCGRLQGHSFFYLSLKELNWNSHIPGAAQAHNSLHALFSLGWQNVAQTVQCCKESCNWGLCINSVTKFSW